MEATQMSKIRKQIAARKIRVDAKKKKQREDEGRGSVAEEIMGELDNPSKPLGVTKTYVGGWPDIAKYKKEAAEAE